jgi:hypothetical protein
MSNENKTKRNKRSVHWNEVVKIYQLDDFEEDRRSCWLTIAADRARFRRRMQCLALVLEPVLMKKHRRYLQNVSENETKDAVADIELSFIRRCCVME